MNCLNCMQLKCEYDVFSKEFLVLVVGIQSSIGVKNYHIGAWWTSVSISLESS